MCIVVVGEALGKLRNDAHLAEFLEIIVATINYINGSKKKLKGMQLVTVKSVCTACICQMVQR
jgi:hypothetical protein